MLSDSQLNLPEVRLLLKKLLLVFVWPEADCSGDRSTSIQVLTPSIPFPQPARNPGQTLFIVVIPLQGCVKQRIKVNSPEATLGVVTYRPNPNYVIVSCQTPFHWSKMLFISHKNVIFNKHKVNLRQSCGWSLVPTTVMPEN